MRHPFASRFLLLTALSTAACAPDVSSLFDPSGSTGHGGSGGEGGGTTGSTTTSGHGGGTTTTVSSSTTSSINTSGSTGGCDPGLADDDADGDGWNELQGDCDDCDVSLNPGAIEIPSNVQDDNCNGQIDEPIPTCDDAIGIDTQDPMEAVRATDLCKISGNQNDWGIIQAQWTMPDGSPPALQMQQLQAFHLGHGVLPDFGPNVLPRGGKRLLALSNGTARRPSDPGYQNIQGFDKGYSSAAAPGLPKESASCPGAVSAGPVDSIALDVLVRVPSNARAFSFDFSFYAWDFPAYVCSQYNDVFFAWVQPTPEGFVDGIVSYDELGNPISVNGANFRVCGCMNGPPCNTGGKAFECPLGIAQLAGTGFDQGANGFTGNGATGWLTTTVAVEPGSQVGLRWGAYDAGDGIGDATVLIDHWQWVTDPLAALTGTNIAQ